MAKTVIVTKIDGKVKCDTDLNYLFSTMRNGTYTLTIKRASEKRTVSQNSLMWMWFGCLENDTGTPKQDFHDYYCKKFLKREVVVNDKVEVVVGETSKLSTQQMTEFLNKVQADVATEWGIRLPVPEDRYFEEFYQQYNF